MYLVPDESHVREEDDFGMKIIVYNITSGACSCKIFEYMYIFINLHYIITALLNKKIVNGIVTNITMDE